MCGIGGILFSTEGEAILQKKMAQLNALQRHRGPDGQFSLVLERHAFCHQRLALLDAAGHRQPFSDISGRYIIVYNGQLYNYIELKEELLEHYSFTTISDTEVVLAAFIVWGEACLHRFDGMFSFVIWDTQTSQAFTARDPLGVKPFVYFYHHATFFFASELKALLQIIGHPLEIDPYVLAEYVIAPSLSGGGEKALFKGLFYLEPGCSLRISSEGISLQQYYHFNWKQTSLLENKLVASLADAMEHSVQICLRTDEPLGIFLSGGLDSSIIAAIAARHRPSLPAYSIIFDHHADIHFDPATIVNSDDLPHARELAGELSLPFHQVKAELSSLSKSFEQLVAINDRIPAWEQEFSQHFLAQAAAKQVKAVLVGDAADETHFGYFFLLNEVTNKSPLGLMHLFGGHKRAGLLAPHLQKRLPLHYLDEHYRKIVRQAGYEFDKGAEEAILAMSCLVNRRWLARLLHNGDIHTMHFGLEARVPFANRSLLDIACQIGPDLGFKEGREKAVLRQAAGRWLPQQLCARKKSALPRDPRLGKRYQRLLLSLLEGENDFIDAFLHRPALLELCQLVTIHEADRMILFNIICLIYWANLHEKNIVYHYT